jgi:transposase
MLPSPNKQVLLYHQPIDLRKSYKSLCSLVEQELKRNSQTGDAIIFINRRKTLAKVLWWDRTGWCLLLKSLSGSRFRISENNELLSLKKDKARAFFDGL